MYIDENIPIPPNMPRMLQEDFAILQDYYDKGDWPHFDMYWEGVEGQIKSFHLTGRITKQEALQLMHRYGIY